MLGCGLLSVAAWGQAGRDSQALYELLNRIQQLEQETRQLRGDLELLRYRQEEEKQRLDERFLQLEQRLQAGAPVPGSGLPEEPLLGEGLPPVTAPGAATAPPPAAAPPPVTAPGAATVPPAATAPATTAPAPAPSAAGPEQADYDAAFKMLREGRYEQAIDGFQAFLNNHGNSSLAPDALYWLGETYYVNREFDQAKEAFINLGTHFPSSSRLPDALLKLGYTYQEINDKAKARQVLQRLVQDYPDTTAARLAEQRLQSLR